MCVVSIYNIFVIILFIMIFRTLKAVHDTQQDVFISDTSSIFLEIRCDFIRGEFQMQDLHLLTFA